MLTRTLNITDFASFEAAIKNANPMANEDPAFNALCAYVGDSTGKRIAFMLPDKKGANKSGLQASFECIASIKRRNGRPPVVIQGYGRIESCLTLWDYFQNNATEDSSIELSPFTKLPLYNGWDEDYGFDYSVISDQDKLAVRALLINNEWKNYYPSIEEFIQAMGLYNENLEKGTVEKFLYMNELRFRSARKQYEIWAEENEPGAILMSKKRKTTNKVAAKNTSDSSFKNNVPKASKLDRSIIRDLIATGKLVQAIHLIKTSSIGGVEIALLSEKLNTLKRNVRMGIVSRANENLERSRIVAALLELL